MLHAGMNFREAKISPALSDWPQLRLRTRHNSRGERALANLQPLKARSPTRGWPLFACTLMVATMLTRKPKPKLQIVVAECF